MRMAVARVRRRAARGSCVLRVVPSAGAAPADAEGRSNAAARHAPVPASVRTRWPGYPACMPSSGYARAPGPTRTAAASRKRAPRTMRETEYCASRFRYGTRRSAIGRLRPQRPRARPRVDGRRQPFMRGALSLISRPYLRGNLLTMPARRSHQFRRRVCSHVTWSLDPPHSQWIESPPNLAFT
ncbi:exported hypothetical protein [Burkholderia vietnamiensis]|nr:exported hypothetical protein [Burkholderia vietnamiensis]